MITTLTSSTYFSYIRANPNYTIVTIKSPNCKPCTKAYGMYEKVAEKYASSPLFAFAVYELSKPDANFIMNTLDVKAVPTFDVYNTDGKRIFRMSSAKNFEMLEDFIEALASVPMSESTNHDQGTLM